MNFVVRMLAAVVALGALPAWPLSAQEKVVNVYNWSDYIDQTIIEDFTKATGIKVRYDVYDSNDLLETKLLAGKTGYDVVVPTNGYLARQIKAKVLAKLDKAKLPNLKHMDKELMARMAKYDPDNAHSVIYLWGTTGIGVNVDKIKQRMPKAPLDSLKMIFDPTVVAKFADCGVHLLDAPDEIIGAALKYIGEDPDSKNPDVLAKAEGVLKKIRPHIRKFHSSQYINDLANGDICLAFGWSGDILQAGTRATEAKKGVTVEYHLPKEGAIQWFDSFAIPADAPNKDNAHAFINYMMTPAVIAKASNFVQYPNGNKDSQKLIAKEVTENVNVFPPPAVVKRLYTLTPYDQKTQRLVTGIWTRVKGGS
jgi:putrescine transport system substrate-binding protein